MNDFEADKLLISRAEDTIELSEKHCCLKFLGFLTPDERSIIEHSVLIPYDIICGFFGGYDYAERTIFTARPDFLKEISDDDIPIKVIEITGRDISNLSHRDYLGSILGLGIKREKVGDIIVLEDKGMVFVLSDIAEYILNNLTKIGRVGIKARIKEICEAETPPPKFKEVNGTVSSLRLDCILSLALSVSRSIANNLISGKKVFVNWRLEIRSDFILDTGDMISVRGFGRFRIKSLNDFSRKNRQHITIEKFV